jgi:hypothetical protein
LLTQALELDLGGQSVDVYIPLDQIIGIGGAAALVVGQAVIVSKAVGELRKNFQMTFPTSSLG